MEGRHRTQYDPHPVKISFKGVKVYTKQSFRDECDINILMASYKRSGVLPHLAGGLPSYGDFTSATDYHTAHNAVIEAKLAFDELPSEIRTQMDNDPHKLLQFLEDPNNREEAENLGLFQPEPQDSSTETGAPEGKRAPDSGGETPPE